MRNSLGRIFIFMLIASAIYAEDFTYNFKINNKTPYLKEAIFLSLELNQTNPDIVLLFSFDIKKSKNYSFKRLDTIETDTHHNTKVKYFYLIYPLKTGKIDIDFNLIKKITTDDSIAFSFSGDRDNVKGLVTKDTKITLPSLPIDVKNLPKETQLIGDFKLSYTIKNHQAKAYEPLPFQVTIEGIGYPPKLDILPKDTNFTKFIEDPIIKSKGTKQKILYSMAISHSKSFNLEPIIIKAFNPKIEKSYELKIPKQKFDIKQVEVDKLVDKRDSPPLLKQDWSWLTTFLSYIVVFIAGYLTAFSLNLKWKQKETLKKSTPLESKIENAQDKKELLQLLMANNSILFADIINRLENSIYRGTKIDFKKLKQEVLNLL